MSKSSSIAASIPKSAITIGGVNYDVNVTKIPYLSSFVNFQGIAQPQSKELVHESIPLFDIALKGVESGYRHCFRALSTELSQYHTLCDTYHFLHVDVLGGQAMNEILSNLKSGFSDYDEDRYTVKGIKAKPRDSAFKLLYLIVLGEFVDEVKDSAKIFDAVLYLVSHPATFKWRARTVVRAAYEERFVVSAKQRIALDKWERTDLDKLATEDSEDVTTEEEDSDFYYDSD
ncbi:uncharacterized protein RSE6_06790 [Rhynchosporium secalis]|uniref:Uncharacterized protein n=1 Tax=Rhynchosporium secalis TaxID=38038 RepID=A0A1E1MB89_RHYSE|nr:uncharacterized protein RSE6_06790 [Rhynchosporium secalis]